jgi:uncharacterized protein YjbJ (UPF0337 family)
MPENREKLSGKSKEAAGKITGDERLEAEGRTQHNTAEGKEAAESAVDKAKGALKGLKESFSKDKR